MRPFIHVNCAMSADGKIAGVERTQVRISNEEDMLRAKELRRRYNAILAGVGTITADDPHLTIKGASAEENPVRIIIDPKGRTPKDAQAVDDRATTLILTEDGCTEEWKNAYIIECGKPFDLTAAMRHLADWGIENMLVEGGGKTIASFFEKNIVDRYTVFIGAMIIGGKDAPTPADGDGWVAENGLKMRLKNAEILGDGVLLTYEAIR